MSDLRYGAAVGVLAGLASGVLFGILVYVATSEMLVTSMSLGLAVLEGIAGGAATGLCAGLIYSCSHERFPVEYSRRKALAVATAFALPWALSWLFILPLSFNGGSNSYTMFIHKLGIETPWVQIPLSSQQLIDLEDFSGIGGYFTVYFLLVLAWVLMFGHPWLLVEQENPEIVEASYYRSSKRAVVRDVSTRLFVGEG